ncbi:protein of unknown function [Burkholderia multivorans]
MLVDCEQIADVSKQGATLHGLHMPLHKLLMVRF